MDYLVSLFSKCSVLQKPGSAAAVEEDASEIQLNAFEHRNYRTDLEVPQHRLVERVVNQWCAMLVKGKTLPVNGFEEKVYMDKDLLGIERDNEYYPLKEMSRLEMLRDPEDMMMSVPYCVEITFTLKVTLGEPRRVVAGNWDLRFNFEQEHQRLNFALTLRILRTRDPTLDASKEMTVLAKDEEDDDEDGPSFGKIVGMYHYNVDAGIPIVFSVSDLKIYRQLQSSSRHVYLEFFVRYPQQDRFLYAKSPTTHIPQKVLMTEDAALRKKRERRDEVDEAMEDKKKSDKAQQSTGPEIVIDAMRFDLKNVKLRVPKVPHTIFGRLMAKDDYFPTAVGTFDFDVKRSFLEDRRQAVQAGKDANSKKEPEILQIPMMSSWRMQTGQSRDDFAKIGLLTLRVIGYVTDPVRDDKRDGKANGKKSSSGVGEEDDSEEEEEEEEEGGNEEDSEEEESN